ncbi:MAG: heme biosynthesis protein HemY [Neisseriaceae bacterium]|nr:heme biosynthesis protein HemY [Neisseriaceae bacterium]
MRALIWLIILFALAIGIALLTQNYHGSAHIVIDNTHYSMNLNTLIIGIILLWVLLYILVRLTKTIAGIPGGFRKFSRKQHQKRADQELSEAGMAFFAGRYSQTSQHTKRLLTNSEAGKRLPLALVLAAYAAQADGNVNERNSFLKRLESLPEKYQLPRYLLLAEDALVRENYDDAVKYIQSANKISPDLVQTVRLDLRRAIAQQDVDSILKNAKQLRKKGAIGEQEASDICREAYSKILEDVSDAKEMKRCLKRIPEAEKNSSMLVKIIEKYRDNGQYREVVNHVRYHYPNNSDDKLLSLLNDVFVYLPDNEQGKLFDDAEKWLKQRPDNASLLYTLGRMATTKQLWGKAQSYLEASLSQRKSIATHLALAKVFTDSGRLPEAEQQQQAALQLMSIAEVE